MLKLVLDTNQFVSSLIVKKGVPAQLLQAWYDHLFIMITSREILKEIERVLHYPRIFQKYHLTEENVKALVAIIEHEAIVLSDTPTINIIKEDPTDNKVLSCALEARANYIISGDRHLLGLRQYQDISIVTPREFLDIIDYKP